MANGNLSKAKSAKNDEFYTQYADIQKEVNAYLEYDADAFRGKTILLPCDDPEWSNFTKFFAQNFEQHYENYDAIEVPFTDAIPSDYKGVMGVPISFLDKYCPEQFEILGMCENEDLYGLKTRVYSSAECKAAYLAKFGKPGTYDLNASGVLNIDGFLEKTYHRLFIRHRRVEK